MGEIKLRYVYESEPIIDQIIQMGDENSKTLGHLPKDAFREYARKEGIIVAMKKTEIVGYCLFRRQKRNNLIKIAQLCVNSPYRGMGVGDKLIGFLKNEFKTTFRGIALNCRLDYVVANKLWRRNGFFCKNERRSRSRKENYLGKWHYDFNHPNLFNSIPSSKIKALVDLNIIIKYSDLAKGEIIGEEELEYLFNDDIITEVDYYHALESFSELLRDENIKRRKRTRDFLSEFKETVFKEKKFTEVIDEIYQLSPPKNENDKSDRRQLAEAVVNNIPYFITTDGNLVKKCKVVENHFNINILFPSQFIVKFDQIQNSESYLPRRIGGSHIEIRNLITSDFSSITGRFQKKGEKESSLRKKIDKICMNPDGDIKVVREGSKILAILGFHKINDEMEVLVFRLRNFHLKNVLASQLITEMVRISVSKNLKKIRVLKSELEDTIIDIFSSFHFFSEREGFVAKVSLPGEFLSKDLFVKKQVEPFIVKDFDTNYPVSNDNKYHLERAIYPGKIIDLNIQNFIIPIKPYWASHLFDYFLGSASLFGSNERLIWNRRNVYYRSKKPDIEVFPGRILWYVTKDKTSNNVYGGRSRGIIACSYIENIKIDFPKNIYKNHKKIGIYKWENLKKLAKNDPNTLIKAIEFSDTEVFKNIITLSEVRKILGKDHNFQSPLRISSDHFFQIYRNRGH